MPTQSIARRARRRAPSVRPHPKRTPPARRPRGPGRSYTPRHRNDPRDKYLSCHGGRWRVRIPLNSDGSLRLTLGGFQEAEEARFARYQILRRLGVTVDSPPSAIHRAARAWLRRRR